MEILKLLDRSNRVKSYEIKDQILPYWTLDKIDVGQGATNGSSLTTLGLGYLG